jgi:hypothetical protein
MKTDPRLGAALVLALTASAALMAQTATQPAKTPLPGQAAPAQTFSATIYMDYRFFLSDAGPITLKPTDPTVAYLSNQFVFRRVYFTYENKINDHLKFRFRLDADNTANVTGVGLINGTPAVTSTDNKLRPYIKNLYFEWTGFLLKDMILRVGMESTLTFSFAEAKWGYRSVAKTVADGFKDITGTDNHAPSADIGASLQGSPLKFLSYGVQVTNGGGYAHPEMNQWKKFAAQAIITPVAGVSVVGYIDGERQQYQANPLNLTKPMATTYKVDAFFETIKGLTIGGEWFNYKDDLYQALNAATDSQEVFNVNGWSVFGHCTLVQNKLNAFARYDSYVPNSLNRAKDIKLAILGLDWAPIHSSLKFQPNIWIYNYADGAQYNPNATSNTDLLFNLTFFLSF